jgi:cell wall-associated NlpC family hydrolase
MRKALGCTLLSVALAGGLALPAAAAPATDRSTTPGGTVQATALSPKAAAQQRPTLRLGARTPAVVHVQRTLGVRPVSGYYGPITRAAVTRLQRSVGLPATGIVDRATWRVLLRAKGVIRLPAEPAATPTKTPAPKPTPTKAPAPKPTPTKTPAPKPTPTKTPAAPAPSASSLRPTPDLTPEQAAAARPSLRFGMGPGDPAVVFVQQFLRVTPTSGYFGTRTRTAVTAYQRALGIDAIGVVGPRTWAAIHAGTRPPAVAPTAPPTSPPATPVPVPTGSIPTPTHPLPAQPRARDHALVFALAQVGKRYVLGGNGPDVWDCSGLVQQAYRRAGVQLPRLASQQRFAGTRVSLDELLPGDLLYYQDGSSPRRGHISMYAGNGLVVEAANPRRGVRIRTLHEAWYRDRFVAATRIG